CTDLLQPGPRWRHRRSPFRDLSDSGELPDRIESAAVWSLLSFRSIPACSPNVQSEGEARHLRGSCTVGFDSVSHLKPRTRPPRSDCEDYKSAGERALSGVLPRR